MRKLMSVNVKVIAFGIISGLIWSMIASGLHFDSVMEAASIFLAGALTGTAVSFALKTPLARLKWWWTLVFGLISLPLGAFIYGLLFSLFNISEWLNGSQYGVFTAVVIGADFALISVISLCALYFIPLAVLTTFILRAVIHFRKNAV